MRALFLSLIIGILPFALSAQEVTAPRSDAAIKQLALEAILENPEIIVEAMTLIEEQRAAAQVAAQARFLRAQRDLLQDDPNAPSKGDQAASVVIVEFFDYNCPYCKRAAREVETVLASDSDLRVVYREWPILGEGSVFAARAALAARAQGKYQQMHTALMGLRGRAEEANVLAAARELGLDMDRLRADMTSEAVSAHIATSQQLAQALGITGTPAFVIGDAVVPGAVSAAQLQDYLSAARAAR